MNFPPLGLQSFLSLEEASLYNSLSFCTSVPNSSSFRFSRPFSYFLASLTHLSHWLKHVEIELALLRCALKPSVKIFLSLSTFLFSSISFSSLLLSSFHLDRYLLMMSFKSSLPSSSLISVHSCMCLFNSSMWEGCEAEQDSSSLHSFLSRSSSFFF